MIRRIRIHNFKSFRRAELNVGPFTIIVGPNASGKSNIRDAFRFLHGIGRGYTLADIIGGRYGAGGQSEWAQMRGAASEIVRFGEDCFRIEVDLFLKAGFFTYGITVQRTESSRSAFRVIAEHLNVNYDYIYTSHPGPDDAVHNQDDESHLLLRMAKTGGQRRIGNRASTRPDQPALTQLTEMRSVSRFQREMIEQVIEALGSIRFLDLVPEAMRQPAFPGQTVLGDSGDNLPTVLQEICLEPERKAVLTDWIRELTPMDVVDFEFPINPVTGHVQLALKEGNGSVVSAYSASDGTLRFLSMLAALLGNNPANLYFFEEIDNGIHPDRLRLLLDLIESQTQKNHIQVVTTTHSPELLSMVGDKTFDYTSVVFRPEGHEASGIYSVKELPNASDLRSRHKLGQLHASGWLEDAVTFLSED
jgi:predicted ATPase